MGDEASLHELLLVKAAMKGSLEKVRQLLADGHSANERGEPLTAAEMKAVKWILNEAGTETAAESIGRMIDITPLMAAAESGNAAVVEVLIEAGAEVNAEDSFKRTALMIAIRWKSIEIANRLLKADADVNAKDLSGDTVLTQAIRSGLWSLAHALLDHGAKAAPKGKKDCLPLTVASYGGSEAAASVIRRLLDAGAKPADATVFASIVERQSRDLVCRFLMEYPALAQKTSPDRLLELAAKRRDAAIIRTLSDAGIRATNLPGEPSAITAVIIGPPRSSVEMHDLKYVDDQREIACVEAAIAAGADVNHLGNRGSPPLSWTISFYRSKLCRCLLDHGANSNVTGDGNVLLNKAREKLADLNTDNFEDENEIAEIVRRRRELERIIAMLEDASDKASTLPATPVNDAIADASEIAAENIERVGVALCQPMAPQQKYVARQPALGADLLYEAIKEGDVKAAAAAISSGAKLDLLPPQSDSSYLVTAIGCAIYNRDDRIVNLLLSAGADPNFGGLEPTLPQMATWAGNTDQVIAMMVKLLKAGADVNARKSDKEANPFLASGQTTLMKVSQSARLNYVKLLLKYGADATITDDAGRTTLDYAELWLREVKKDQLKDVPSFADETHESAAKAVVDLLEAVSEGRFDFASLPTVEELISAERKLVGAK